ncbi:MAG: dTMP kinase [Sedimentisphaerales bacterium]|nr:dTMP kinase [Sedimentisphaerales bacterium]
MRGKFIVLDGPDGCGKSTQIRLLKDVLKNSGVPVLVVRDPGGTMIGERIRQIILDDHHTEMSIRCEALLFMASRAQLYHQCIGPALKDNMCVICDRWVSSTYAYQAVAGRLGADYVLNLADTALERTWPDLTFIIDLPSDIGLERLGATPDRMEQKPAQFHQQVSTAFVELARRRHDFRIIDGSGTIQEVHEKIREEIATYVDV